MAINLNPPDPAKLLPIDGVELASAEAGIRKRGGRDLMLMRLAAGSRVAGVFTQNSFAAAPVQVCRRRLAAGGAIDLVPGFTRLRRARGRHPRGCPTSSPLSATAVTAVAAERSPLKSTT